MSERARRSYEQLLRALARLDEASTSRSDLALDATIQRFEFVFELVWKTLRHVLLDSGVTTTTPRNALKAAFQAGLINDETMWLALLDARNLTSHTYHEELAARVYATVIENLPTIHQDLERLAAAIDESAGL